MSYEKEEDERSEINWDHEVVRGCKKGKPNIKIQALRKFKFTPKSILLKTKPIVVKIISNIKKIISKII